MHRRCGSTCGYTSSNDLEQGFRCSGAMDCQSDSAATCMLQPPLQLIPLFRQPCTLSASSDRPETQQEYQARVVRCAYSKSERVIAWIALNNPKTTLVDFKTLTARADILNLYKRVPQVGLVQVSRPCHIGWCWMLCVTLQGPGAGAYRMDIMDRSPGAENLKTV